MNVNGVLFTAQAAGRQMARFGNGGSIILIASMSGSITNKVSPPNRPRSRLPRMSHRALRNAQYLLHPGVAP